MTRITLINHRHADHKVVPIFDEGCAVKIPYKGYEISLASDGSSTWVYRTQGGHVLFETDFTKGESIMKAFEFIDEMINFEEWTKTENQE
jgi:hypothetical protein